MRRLDLELDDDKAEELAACLRDGRPIPAELAEPLIAAMLNPELIARSELSQALALLEKAFVSLNACPDGALATAASVESAINATEDALGKLPN